MGENNNFDRMLNIYDIIQSIYPAAQFSTTGSEKKVVLESRGPNSLFSGNEALLVVDGIVTADISGISPAQVKSVKVLVGNDAADWGSRGVITSYSIHYTKLYETHPNQLVIELLCSFLQ